MGFFEVAVNSRGVSLCTLGDRFPLFFRVVYPSRIDSMAEQFRMVASGWPRIIFPLVMLS